MNTAIREGAGSRAVRITIISVALIASCAPVLYGVLLSLRPFSAILNNPLDVIPAITELDLDSYIRALTPESAGGFGLGTFLINSLFLALGTVVVSVLVSILGAYAAARLRYRGRSLTNAIIISVYMFPGIVLAVPLFVMLSRFGLTGSFIGLLVVYVALTVPVSMYMMRNYFLALPESIEEAALIDGCNLITMIWRVVLPIALPGIIATSIYVFMIAWNEYLYALLFLVQERELWTAPLGISQLTDFDTPVTVLLASSVIVTIPVIVGFYFTQRFLVGGLTAGAEK